MKLVGALLIVAASFAIGANTVGGERKRLKIMRSVCMALELMEGELIGCSSPVSELCGYLAEKSDGSVKAFFQELEREMYKLGEKVFSDIWKDAVYKNLHPLGSDSLEELARLGDILGRFELSKQAEAIKACKLRLTDSFETASKSFPEKKKIHMTVSMAVATMVIIVLF